MSEPKLNISRIPDPVQRANFAALQDQFKSNVLLSGDLTLLSGSQKGNGTSIAVPHKLKFKPTDALFTSAIWSGTVGTATLKFSSFDDTNVYFDVSGQGASDTFSYRLLVGRIGS